MKRKIRVTESELIQSIEKIVKEQTAVLGFGRTNGFSNFGIGQPTEKYRELGENGGGNYNVNVYSDPDSTEDGMGIFEDDYFEDDYVELEEDCLDEDCDGTHEELTRESVEDLVRKELLETQAKEAKKWIQGAVKRPGALRKKLGVGKDKKISLAMIDKKMKQIKANDSNKKKKGVQGLTKADLRTYKQLNLAKTLRRMAKKKHASEAKRHVKK